MNNLTLVCKCTRKSDIMINGMYEQEYLCIEQEYLMI